MARRLRGLCTKAGAHGIRLSIRNIPPIRRAQADSRGNCKVGSSIRHAAHAYVRMEAWYHSTSVAACLCTTPWRRYAIATGTHHTTRIAEGMQLLAGRGQGRPAWAPCPSRT
ncbi:hypothetical protein L202_02036 [Cryptococcus amylolentus CBS 6039]|uniref:Uncharacterized protein n=1 Tax=Cryptococcus amylolentus CBS 6039 TaxID=1295533 RepID=A0A1E3HZ54_9TREE|nr:hypothetical protein L202_02036 [Cryptococcus amylolentus CBS 6039]ODN81632.1 hypothetical protein L202_02036 [Cryptococcus amylolentus CBS 6039]